MPESSLLPNLNSPRPDHVDTDLQRIVAHVLTSFPNDTIHTTQLAALLRTHLEL